MPHLSEEEGVEGVDLVVGEAGVAEVIAGADAALVALPLYGTHAAVVTCHTQMTVLTLHF